MEKKTFSKYEKSRILGARALQIAMNAPLLININQEELEEIHFDPLKIAEKELESGILPISVNRPLPKRKEERLKRTKDSTSEKEVREREESEEEEIAKEGEIMELATPSEEKEYTEEEEEQ